MFVWSSEVDSRLSLNVFIFKEDENMLGILLWSFFLEMLCVFVIKYDEKILEMKLSGF